MPEFPLAAYLARLGWTGPVAATPETLVALHRHHAFTFPFENLDPFSGRPVSLEPAALVDKMIHHSRGGYCFEQNGLFLLALESIGFRTRSLLGRVRVSEGRYGLRSHQITLVDFGRRSWLADVGFGGHGLVDPIPLEPGRECAQPLDRFRLAEDPDHGYRLEHRRPERWRTLYAFSLDPYLPADYAALNYFLSRAPESMFVRVPICVRTTATERRLIVADRFKIRTAAGPGPVTPLKTSAELRAVLADQLGLVLPADFPLPAPPPPPAGLREI